VSAVPLLPPTARKLVPDRVRHDVRLRAVAVGLGVIPPRAMHSTEEAELLVDLATQANRIVEIGVYEGGSAVEIAKHMPSDGELHLIDPFGKQPGALPRDWAATEWATKRTVARAAKKGPRLIWHATFSHDAAQTWSEPIDLLFIDGDHLEAGVRQDWEDWHEHVRPGGHVAFHDSRQDKPHGRGLPGPTKVVDDLFRDGNGTDGWTVVHEVDRTTVVRRS
jgi:predicted O-methyltransferase YrrM